MSSVLRAVITAASVWEQARIIEKTERAFSPSKCACCGRGILDGDQYMTSSNGAQRFCLDLVRCTERKRASMVRAKI